MKEHILQLILLSVLSVIPVYGQYAPNVVKNGQQWALYREWGCDPYDFKYMNHITDLYFFGADTVIEDKTYKQVFYQEDFNPNREFCLGLAYRKEETRLYVYEYRSKKEYLVCDYSLQPGDIMPMDWDMGIDNYYVVDYVGDTVLPGSTTALRYLKVHDGIRRNVDLWVENIGPLSRGLYWDKFCWAETEGGYRYLICCYDEENIFYKVRPNEDCHRKEMHFSDNVFHAGKLAMTPCPVTKNFTGFDSILCLRTESRTYILAENWEWTPKRYITFNGTTAAVGDCLSVEGTSNYGYDLNGKKYDELNIRSVKQIPCDKLSSENKTANDGTFLKVLPNPNNGNFRVEVNRPCSVEFYTETGVLVESRKVDAGTHNFSLETGKNAVGRAIGGAGKATGLYILKATAADGQMLTRKIAIQ